MNQVKLGRHVKIVCTLGPASNSPEVIEEMLRGGEHCPIKSSLRYPFVEIRRLSQKLKLPTGILLDLPGSKSRVGDTQAVFEVYLEFARTQNTDFVALSFLTSVRQVTEVKGLLKEMNLDPTNTGFLRISR